MEIRVLVVGVEEARKFDGEMCRDALRACLRCQVAIWLAAMAGARFKELQNGVETAKVARGTRDPRNLYEITGNWLNFVYLMALVIGGANQARISAMHENLENLSQFFIC